MPHVFILQRIVPDYRDGFYKALGKIMPGRFEVTTGSDHFTQGLTASSNPGHWILSVNNTYFCGNRLLWQSGHFLRTKTTPLLVAELNPRIVSTWALLLLRRIAKRPSVVWGHSRSLGKRGWLVGHLRFWQCRLADGVVSYTGSQSAEFRGALPKKRVFTVPNACVDESRCKPVSSANPRSFLYIGRLISEKKLTLLLNAFVKAEKRLPPDIMLELVGDGPMREELANAVSKLSLNTRVVFHGHTTESDKLDQIYARALCCVSPGYVGLTAIQSLARGVPMLVADKEWHSPEIEVCVEDKTARFFASDDVDDLADKLVAMYEERDEWKRRRKILSGKIRETYTYQAMARAFSRMVEDMGCA